MGIKKYYQFKNSVRIMLTNTLNTEIKIYHTLLMLNHMLLLCYLTKLSNLQKEDTKKEFELHEK